MQHRLGPGFEHSASGAQSAGQQSTSQQSMPGMDMSGSSGHDMSNMQMQTKTCPWAAMKRWRRCQSSRHELHGRPHGHGPAHEDDRSARGPSRAIATRAQQVGEAARKASEKYMDYHVALADGFKIFLPKFRRRCTTSPITATAGNLSSTLIRSIRRLCSMKNMETTTS